MDILPLGTQSGVQGAGLEVANISSPIAEVLPTSRPSPLGVRPEDGLQGGNRALQKIVLSRQTLQHPLTRFLRTQGDPRPITPEQAHPMFGVLDDDSLASQDTPPSASLHMFYSPSRLPRRLASLGRVPRGVPTSCPESPHLPAAPGLHHQLKVVQAGSTKQLPLAGSGMGSSRSVPQHPSRQEKAGSTTGSEVHPIQNQYKTAAGESHGLSSIRLGSGPTTESQAEGHEQSLEEQCLEAS